MRADPTSDVPPELDRVGASSRKAGAGHFISITIRADGVRLKGPSWDHPRRSWLGPERQALELLVCSRTMPACERCGGRWTLAESQWVGRLAPERSGVSAPSP